MSSAHTATRPSGAPDNTTCGGDADCSAGQICETSNLSDPKCTCNKDGVDVCMYRGTCMNYCDSTRVQDMLNSFADKVSSLGAYRHFGLVARLDAPQSN